MKIPGLHLLISRKREAATAHAQRVRQGDLNPREAHDLATEADILSAQADAHAEHVKSDEELVSNIESLISYLNHSPIKSAYRTLALRDLECASGRLLREVGDVIEG